MSRAPLVLAALLASWGGADPVGDRPPDWGELPWAQGEPATLADLRGKVVLVRWWTDGCRWCATTAPALQALADELGPDGLAVVGMYHPKPPRSVSAGQVREAAARLGLRIPVAIDADWTVLRRWWLDGGARPATSVSFLLDRDGVVRHVHPGPVWAAAGDPNAVAGYRELRAAVEKLLRN